LRHKLWTDNGNIATSLAVTMDIGMGNGTTVNIAIWMTLSANGAARPSFGFCFVASVREAFLYHSSILIRLRIDRKTPISRSLSTPHLAVIHI
jgi:hypothetical protein